MPIEKSYGTIVRFGGIPVGVVGNGYGKDQEVTAAVDSCGDLLERAFPKAQIVLRANSDGLSGGACVDGPWHFNLGAGKRDGRLYYTAYFRAPVKCAKALIGDPRCSVLELDEYIGVSPRERFARAEDALAWLLEYGRKFCPSMRRSGNARGLHRRS